MRKCQCMKFCASFPVAPQGRGNGTFLILRCFCIAKHSPRSSPSRAVRLKWKRHCEPVRTLVWQSRGSSWSPCRGRCRAQLFAAKERYRCGLPPAGTHRPASAILHRAIVFECRGGRLCPPAKAPLYQEGAVCTLRRLGEFQSSKKRKRAMQNRNCKPCRHHVTAQLSSLDCPHQVTRRSPTTRRTPS